MVHSKYSLLPEQVTWQVSWDDSAMSLAIAFEMDLEVDVVSSVACEILSSWETVISWV